MRSWLFFVLAPAVLIGCDDGSTPLAGEVDAFVDRDGGPLVLDDGIDDGPDVLSDAQPDARPDMQPDAAPTEGLAPAEATGGPAVVWDPEALPLPDIPLPNDALTRRDPSTPTGRRVDIPLAATTAHENDVRAAFNEMDGFGAFAPIFVSFDRRLDLADIDARHNGNDDFRDDALFLLNVDRDCARFGEEVAVDLGRGRYPATIYRHSRRSDDPAAPGGYRLDEGGNAYFRFDRLGESNSILFPEFAEDSNGDGVLQPEEDLDGDGRLDIANLWPTDACDGLAIGSRARDRCVADHLLTWYEYQTDTLILRPVWPLEQACTYAVVLTERLRGEDGAPIRSPLPFVNLPRQTAALEPIVELLPRYGLTLDDVAFAWTMTVGSQTRDLEALRAGLYGHGPFAALAEQYPPEDLRLWTRAELGGDADDDRPLIPGACAGAGLTYLWQHGIGEWDPNMCALEADNSAIAGVFGGTFDVPYLLVDGDGIASDSHPADDDERWRIDVDAGTVTQAPQAVPFWCAVPHERAECPPGNPEGVPFCKPFPTVIFAHGYGSSRAEITSHMGRHTALGHAVCALDGPGHGLSRWKVDLQAGAALIGARVGFSRYGVPEMAEIIVRGRDRDLNNDGLPDGGADQWTADLFHTRDMVRQSVLEVMQFTRILRAMDGRMGAQGVLGDLDGDGAVDLGGPETTLGMWGISLGGIVAGVVAGAEPSLDAVSPNAGGAGLVDIAMRSSLGGLPDAIVLPMMGPIIAGCLPTDGSQNPLPADAMTEQDCMARDTGEAIRGDTLTLGAYVTELADQKTKTIGRVDGVRPGDRVKLTNLRSGEEAWSRINARGWFRLAVAADALDAVERRPILGLGSGQNRVVTIDDTVQLGDPLQLIFYVGESDEVRATVDTFGQDVTHFATRYPAGAPLVALARGLGYTRNTPGFRRFAGIAQHAIGPADPGVWAAHAVLEPLDFGYDPHRPSGNTRVLYMPVVGDRVVPVNTGVAMARAGGLFGSWLRDESLPAEHGWREIFAPDPRYGTSIDQALIDRHVVEGDHRFQRYADNPVNPNVLYDIDDLSDGAAAFSCGPSDWSGGNGEFECPDEVQGEEVLFSVPHPEPGAALRADRRRDGPDGVERYDAFRIPLVRPAGQHGIYNAQPFRAFDHDGFAVNLTARFLGSGGRLAGHPSGCDCTADRLPNFTLDGAPTHPSFDRACEPDELNLCDAGCVEAWGMRVPDEAACLTD